MDEEMMAALIADGEMLRNLTGKDHGPYFLDDPETWPADEDAEPINPDGEE